MSRLIARAKALGLLACMAFPVALPALATETASDTLRAEKVHPHAQRTAKPDAGITLASGDEYRLQAGRVQQIPLVFRAPAQGGTLHLTVASSDAKLELLSPDVYELALDGQSPPTLQVELLPQENGRYYLMFNARLEQPGQPVQSRAFGAAIQVGERMMEVQRLKAPAAPGVISLPAQESIRPAQ